MTVNESPSDQIAPHLVPLAGDSPGLSGFRAEFQKIIILWRKNIRLYAKRGPVIIFGLLFPFFMMLAWIIGRDLQPKQLFTGMTAMTSFFTSTAISPVMFPMETRERTLEHQIATPLSLGHILAGIVLASATYSFSITTIVATILLVGLQVPLTGVAAGAGLYVGLALMSVLGSCIGALISSPPTDMTSNIMLIGNFVKFPLLFISGIFIPLTSLSTGGRILAAFSPLTYLTDAVQTCVGTGGLLPLGVDLVILVGWIGLLCGVTYLAHARTLELRFSLGGGPGGSKGPKSASGPNGAEKPH